MESRKIVLMNQFAWKEWRPRCREWTCGHSRGRRLEESSIDIYTLLTVKLIDNGKLLYYTGSPPGTL